MGGFKLSIDGRAVRLPGQVQHLLAFLALSNRPLHRAYVAGSLWLEASQEHAYGCLRTTLWRARAVPCPLIDTTSTHLELASSIAVDAHELVRSAERLLHDRAAGGNDIDRVAGARDLLPDWYEDWVLDERERLRQLQLLALEKACSELIGKRQYAQAAEVALAASGIDPLRESAQRLLIMTHLGTGNVADALRQFTTFRARLERELGLEPSPQMFELVGGFWSDPMPRQAPGDRTASTSAATDVL